MAKLSVRYLERRTLADGSTVFFYNAHRDAKKAGILQSITLGTDLAEAIKQAEKFNAILDAWRKEDKLAPVQKHVPGTLDALIDEYKKSRFFLRLRPVTKTSYAQCLKVLANTELANGQRLGAIHILRIKPRAIDKIYERLQRLDENGKPTRLALANKIMAVACTLWTIAGRWEYVPKGQNPFFDMGRVGTGKRHVVWTPEQIALFQTTAIDRGRRSVALAFSLQYELAQRQGDVLNMLWSSYNGTHVEFDQRKTGKEMWLPVSPVLKEMLDNTPRVCEYVVVNELTGQRWGEHYFRRVVMEIRAAAGLPFELKSMDLRRTAATELGDAGATEAEIMSVGGWTNPQTVQRYRQKTTSQAGNGLNKRWNRREQEWE